MLETCAGKLACCSSVESLGVLHIFGILDTFAGKWGCLLLTSWPRKLVNYVSFDYMVGYFGDQVWILFEDFDFLSIW